MCLESDTWTAVPRLENVSCDFKMDACGWDEQAALGPLLVGIGLAHVASAHCQDWFLDDLGWASSVLFRNATLTSPLFPAINATGLRWNFAYFIQDFIGFAAYTGYTGEVPTLELQYFDGAVWTASWSRSCCQVWRRASVQLPAEAQALRFMSNTNSAVDDVGLASLDSGDLACDFEVDSCNWVSGGSTWQHTFRDTEPARSDTSLTTGKSYLSTAANSSETFVLESMPFNSMQHAFAFAYQVIGSHTAALELQCKTASNDWVQLFVKTGGQGSDWHEAIVSIPAGSTALRFLANVTSEDAVSLDSFVVMNVASSLENISCSFDADLCGWVHQGQAGLSGCIALRDSRAFSCRPGCCLVQ